MYVPVGFFFSLGKILNLSYNLTFFKFLSTIPNFYKKVQSG